MPGLPNGSLSILASPLSPATAAKLMVVIIGLLLIAPSLYYASPTRLTRVLSDAMSSLDKVFVEVSAAGLLGLLSPEDMQTVVSTFQMLRVKVGMFQTDTLRNSTSWRMSLRDFFTRSILLFRCIKEVKDFQTHLEEPVIQILQEDYRHRTNSLPLSFATGVSHPTSTARFRSLAS
ncbi:hypothetical protein C8F04DRAFT_1092284 [Mycena alexandri]|uniref:Uncharacterized protein n=1 Tax=Mycena alexandri TaxID=1745969 RepID=A0AAD6T2T8_9AGAR|nr:hypothetical protein C8F04DRAFT_1092284 [Mycena alexandri]